MNYELAKKLKEAGFQFILLPYELFHSKERAIDTLKGIDIDGKLYRIPTLSELIEACGVDFSALYWVVGGWRADGNDKKCDCDKDECDGYRHFEEIGQTPEEAVANLWLGLNKK